MDMSSVEEVPKSDLLVAKEPALHGHWLWDPAGFWSELLNWKDPFGRVLGFSPRSDRSRWAIWKRHCILLGPISSCVKTTRPPVTGKERGQKLLPGLWVLVLPQRNFVTLDKWFHVLEFLFSLLKDEENGTCPPYLTGLGKNKKANLRAPLWEVFYETISYFWVTGGLLINKCWWKWFDHLLWSGISPLLLSLCLLKS